MGDADDDAAMIVELELGADLRILELVELRVLDGDKGVLGEDVRDVARDQLRPAEETGVVEAEDVGRLVGAIAQLEQRCAGIQRHRVFHAGDAAHFVEDVVGQRNGVGDGLHRRIHDPDRLRRC